MPMRRLSIGTSARPTRIELIIAERFRRKQNALSPRRWHPALTCWICAELIRQWQPFNFDHMVPMSKGGRRGRANKAYTHVLCNSVKGDQHPFFLRTAAEREAVRARVRPDVYRRLERVWAGED